MVAPLWVRSAHGDRQIPAAGRGSPQRDERGHRETSSRRIAGDHDGRRVARGCYVAVGGDRVLERSGKRVLGSKAVVDGEDPSAGGSGEMSQHGPV